MKKLLALVLFLVSPVFADTHVWDGSADDGNWATAANWDVAAVPIDGDDVIIDAGDEAIDAGLDQSLIDLTSLTIGPNFLYGIGVSTSTRLEIDTAKLVINGGLDDNIWIEDGSVTSWDEVIIGSVGASGTGTCYLDGVITTMAIHKGKVELLGTATTIYLDATLGNPINATLNTGATITDLYVTDGNVNHTAGTITNVYYDNGDYVCTAGTITNLYQRGGELQWWTTTNMTTAMIFGGIFDASGSASARTITTLTTHYAAAVNLNNVVGNIALTTTKLWAGTVTWPPGSGPDY